MQTGLQPATGIRGGTAVITRLFTDVEKAWLDTSVRCGVEVIPVGMAGGVVSTDADLENDIFAYRFKNGILTIEQDELAPEGFVLKITASVPVEGLR